MNNKTVTVYVPVDAAAQSVGSESVVAEILAEAKTRDIDIQIVRNGSRGMLWLEPLLEVVTDQGRVAYGPVAASDVAGLFDAGFLQGGSHALGHGITEEIDYLKRQTRLTFARVGVIDPLSLDDFKSHGGFEGLTKALELGPEKIVDAVISSGLRGRGGAGFPTGIKWKTVMGAPGPKKYICCNADEGDSGTFADRMLMEGDPFTLIEGMIIAAIAVDADQGFIYLRSEYPHAIKTMKRAIEIATHSGYLGDNIAGSDKRFTVEVRVGGGAYICGE
ncbi:MAG: formate dehydrogenase, partial [Rhodospirillales bacterium]|nr:formate dehydrogenase [Rhodospirillales bacterium]